MPLTPRANPRAREPTRPQTRARHGDAHTRDAIYTLTHARDARQDAHLEQLEVAVELGVKLLVREVAEAVPPQALVVPEQRARHPRPAARVLAEREELHRPLAPVVVEHERRALGLGTAQATHICCFL